MAPTSPSVKIGDILKYNMLMSMHQGQKGKGALQVAAASLLVVSFKSSSLLPVVPTMFAKWGVFTATFVTCAARVPELCGCRVARGKIGVEWMSASQYRKHRVQQACEREQANLESLLQTVLEECRNLRRNQALLHEKLHQVSGHVNQLRFQQGLGSLI